MGDSIDQAQARAEFFNDLALEEHYRRGIRNTMDAAATHCAKCGAEIPEGRRQAQPGCKLCIRCQEQHEIHHHWRAL